MNFWQLVRVIKTRKWVILGIVAVTLLVVAIAAPKPTVVYEASAFMSPTGQVMQGGATTANSDASRGSQPDRGVILSNLIILAQGAEVLDRALEYLASDTEEQKADIEEMFGEKAMQPGFRKITRIETSPGKVLSYQNWNDILNVSPVYNASIGEKGTTTDIIRITIKMNNGDAAPYLANAVAQAFAQAYQDKSREDIRKYAGFLETGKKEAKAELHDIQQRIAEYKRGHNVVAVDAETQAAINAMTSLDAARNGAESAVREAEAALKDINAQLAVQPLVTQHSLPAEMNPAVRKLEEELAQAEADLRFLSQRYKPGHEAYKAAEERIAVVKERIAREGKTFSPPTINEIHQELTKKRSDAQYTLAAARAKLASISGSYAQAQTKVQGLAQAEPGLVELMTEYAQADNRYKMLSEKHAQALIAEREFTKTGSIVPFSWARQSVGPIVQGPSRKALLVYGFVLSLVLGIVAVVWLDSIDNRMRNAADVEKLLELPVMGRTPALTGRDGMLPRLTHLYPLSAMAESYKILRTNLLFALRDNPFKTLMVATGRPGQGATTTICNLAIALAQIGKRVILIDADMRRPSLHKFFDVPNEAGLSTLLQGEGALTDAFQKTEIENLIVVPAGPQPMNPSELLGSDKMRDLVERLEEHCDLVLFDTPSTIVFSDGPMLASWIDAVLMVVSANQVPRGTEVHTRDLLKRAKANILGVVVNRMSPENVDSCYFYSHYYADSAARGTGEAALGTGKNGGNGRGDAKERESIAKAIPAPREQTEPVAAAPEPSGEEEENPFPD